MDTLRRRAASGLIGVAMAVAIIADLVFEVVHQLLAMVAHRRAGGAPADAAAPVAATA